MARRHHRRRNPKIEDMLPIAIGVIGGGMGMYLYMKAVNANASNALATTSTPSTTPSTTPGT